MKKLITISLYSLTICLSVFGQSITVKSKSLFPFSENGKWGFINETGKVVIKPIFSALGQFSEGSAPARKIGAYGFIDSNGVFVIPPQFDMAFSFFNGQAKVYKDGKPYYIDKKGDITFEHHFAEIKGFNQEGASIVVTTQNYYGVINRQGKIILDTIYRMIRPFSNGLAIILGEEHHTDIEEGSFLDLEELNEFVYEMGLINSKGEFVVPFGKYQDIYGFKNGYSEVTLVNGDKGIVDTTGNLLYIKPKKYYDIKDYAEGLASVSLYLTASKDKEDSYVGVVNTQGEIVFSNKAWMKITPFHYHRAFVKDTAEQWFLINREGEILNKKPYMKVLNIEGYERLKPFEKSDYQLVEIKKSVGVIDTNGKITILPQFLQEYKDFSIEGHVVFFKEEHSYHSYMGAWNIKTGEMVSPKFHYMKLHRRQDELIYVVQENRMGYIKQNGTYVWREKKLEEQEFGALNSNVMHQRFFRATSPQHVKYDGDGGWSSSNNGYKKIKKSNHLPKNQFNIKIDQNDTIKYQEHFDGLKMYVFNSSHDTIFFNAQDSRLALLLQAKDKSGKWRDIDYLVQSTCGNSYHTLYLPQKRYWQFEVPVFEGEFETKIRAKLYYFNNSDEKKQEQIIYSHEFDGGINPGQFWLKEMYISTN